MLGLSVHFACAAILGALPGELPSTPIENFPGLPRTMGAASYSPDGRTIYMFGGFDTTGVGGWLKAGNDFWAYSRDSHAWRRIESARVPAARGAHAMSFDPRSNELKLLGGNGDRGCLDTLWTFSPASGQWTPTSGIAKVNGSLLVDRRSTLWSVFGRCGSLYRGIFSRQNDPAAEWEFLQTESPRPVERAWHVAAIDGRRDRLLVYGGSPDAGAPSDRPTIEVWAYSLSHGGWEKLSHAGTGIRQERSKGAGAYSLASDALIVYGGIQTGTLNPEWYTRFGEIFDDLAIFDLQSKDWTIVPVAKRVGPRADAASSYCPCTGTLLVAGGVTSEPIPPSIHPVSSIDEIQIEREGTFRPHAQGLRDNAGQMIGFLEVPDASGDLYDIRLVDCVRGQTVLDRIDAHPVGRGRNLIKFTSESLDPTSARIVGRIRGEPLGFIAKIERGSPREAGFHPHVEAGTLERRAVFLAGSPFDLEAVPGSAIRADVFDIRGRLIARRLFEPQTVHLSIPGMATGLYFVRVSAGGPTVVRRVLLGEGP